MYQLVLHQDPAHTYVVVAIAYQSALSPASRQARQKPSARMRLSTTSDHRSRLDCKYGNLKTWIFLLNEWVWNKHNMSCSRADETALYYMWHFQ